MAMTSKYFLPVFIILLVFFSCRDSNQQQELDEGGASEFVEQGVEEEEPGRQAEIRQSPPRNLPISFGKIRPGEYAILMGKYKNPKDAIARSRELRRLRINNYIYQESEKSYLVLIGHFVTESQALKRKQYLEKKGFKNLQIYAAR